MSSIGERAPSRDGDRQVIEIRVRHGYHPDVIKAQAGMPIRLVFRREDDLACSDRVVFSRPHVDRYLAPRSVTVVDLPPAATGSIRFTCGMGRYRGRIDVVPTDGNARVSRRIVTTAVALVGILFAFVLAVAVGVAGSALSALALALFVAVAVALVIFARHGDRGAHRYH